jgi:PAS domain S-box-containing protein
MYPKSSFERLTAPAAISRSPLARYGLAVVLGMAATLLRLTLDPLWGVQLPYIFFFPAVAISGWIGGFGAGLVTTLLGAFAADYYWIVPYRSFWVSQPADIVGLLVFTAVSTFISALNEAWRRMAVSLAREEERLRVTFASIGDAVIATDENGAVARMNGVAQTLTGWSESDATGRPLEDVFVIINEQTRAAAENSIRTVLRDGIVMDLANHTVLVARDGRETPIDDSAAPIRSAGGEIIGVVLIFRDMSDRRRAEHDRAELLAAERAASEQVRAAEQQLRLALEVGRLGMWRWTVATGEVQWSPALEAIHGYAPGTFPGTIAAVMNGIVPDDRHRVQQSIAAALELDRDHHVEYRIIRSDGAERWVDARGRVTRDENGDPYVMTGICSDITDRKQTEERFRIAVEAAPAAMVVVNARGMIVLANAQLEQLTGYTRAELVNRSIEQLVLLSLRSQHQAFRSGFMGDAQQRPMGAGRELYVLHRNGSEVPVEIGLNPVVTAEGTFVIAAVSDITERKRAAQAERQARQEAEQANRAKDEFLAVLSHELRNPIQAVLGWTHVLRTDNVSPELMAQGLEVIDRNIRTESRLVESLLDVSRIISGKLRLNLERVDLADALTAAVDVVRPAADLKGVLLSVKRSAAPIILTVDEARLQQILWNLMSNAIKFTPRDGRVQVEAAVLDSWACIEVQDDGEGIPPEFLPRIFGRFTQADTTNTRVHGGLGLGLAIVSELVHAHGGSVKAVSAGAGQGSTFTVLLPIAARAVDAAAGA